MSKQSDKQNTRKALKRDLEQFFAYLELKDVAFDNVDTLLIRDYLLYLQKENFSNPSISRKLSTLKNFYRNLETNGFTSDNPTLLISSRTSVEGISSIFTLVEFKKLRAIIDLKKAGGLRDSLVFEFLYSSGITPKELLNISEGLVDLDRRQILISSEGRNRVVFFSGEVKRLLPLYINQKKQKLTDKYTKDILFVNGSGTKLSERSLSRILKKYLEKADLDTNITLNSFRQNFIKVLLENNFAPEEIKSLTGYQTLDSIRGKVQATNITIAIKPTRLIENLLDL